MTVTGRPPIPWLLGGACLAVVVASFRSAPPPPRPPPPAPTAQLEWRVLHDAPARPRGPFGLGVYLTDAVSDRGVTHAVSAGFMLTFRSPDDGAMWEEPNVLQGAVSLAVGDSGLMLAATVRSDIHRSADGGRTWTTVKTEAARGMSGLVLVGNTALVSGPEILLRSRDRGATWQRVSVPKASLHDLAMRESVVLAVGGAGVVVRSDDAGETFETQWLETTTEGLTAVAFVDDTTAVVVGTSGTILRSTDAGRSWRSVSSPTRVLLRSVAFSDARHGLAVGSWGEAILTADGGLTWTRERTGTNAHLHRVRAHPAGGYLVCGFRETILRVREP